jgi:hypothetical protein
VNWDVVEASVSGEYSLSVRFRDGVRGTVRFMPSFFRGVFASLREHSQFNEVQVVDGVVTWCGELDLAPDAMHRAIKEHGELVLS